MSPGRQLGLLWGGVAVALLLLSPLAPALAAGLPGCPFLGLTGLPCPACGSGRAALALARWEPVEALLANPLAAAGWVLLVAGGLVAAALVMAGRALPRLPRRLPLALRLAVAAAVAGNWIWVIRTGSG